MYCNKKIQFAAVQCNRTTG